MMSIFQNLKHQQKDSYIRQMRLVIQKLKYINISYQLCLNYKKHSKYQKDMIQERFANLQKNNIKYTYRLFLITSQIQLQKIQTK
ncbi:unnamed protein product [Paramecium primaurelia]|uniref:Uncharacterized protein n=1 Tax=Paramecium primaurelia TaxID=5886 RepID=A0A8S1KIM8_PARPR|nr:unnamed protein product [Paramecium primaurelia]